MGAGLRQNMGRNGVHKPGDIMKSSPNKVYTSTAEHSAKKLVKDKRKATEEAKQNRRRSKYARKGDTAAARSAYSRHDGGIQPDQVSLEELKSSFYQTRVAVT